MPARVKIRDTGALAARGYLAFLDSFCDTTRADERERELLAQLAENAEKLRRTSFRAGDLDKLQDRLAGSSKPQKAAGSRRSRLGPLNWRHKRRS